MQYNTYVTNKTKDVQHLYVRLRGDKLKESENYSRSHTSVGIEGVSKGGVGCSGTHEEELKTRKEFTSLVQGNFCRLNTNQPTPFAVEDISKVTYLSVHDEEKIWLMDFPVNPGSYGCVTITGNKTDGISAYPSNPKPVWIARNQGDPLPDGAICAGKTMAHGALYFGRATSYSGIPCKVNLINGKFCHNWCYTYYGVNCEKKGDVLIDTGHQFVRAHRGDLMPPNAIMTGATYWDNSLFVGRVGGNIPCKVNLNDKKIKNFWYDDGGRETRTDSGEVLLLINDPAY